MTTIKTIFRWLLALLMLFAGVMHFVSQGFFLKIMPPYLPLHLELVYLSGVFEVGLGICLLIPRFSRYAAWGIIALLIVVFPAQFDDVSRTWFPVRIARCPSKPGLFFNQ